MKIKKGFVIRSVAGVYVVVATGKLAKKFNGMITLNETGAFLWKCLEEDITKEELLEKLLAEYDVKLEQATEDIDNFLKQVVEAKLVE